MKSILITGSARGLGKELALKFSGDTFNIIIQDRDKESLFKVRKRIVFPKWANCDAVLGDLREDEIIEELFDLSDKHNLDILINNAGVRSAGKIKDMKNFDIEEMIKTNLLAPIKLTKALYPIFLKKKSGLIININSIAGKMPNSEEAVYCASKYGLRGFFDSFRFEAAEHNIIVLSIYLGAMNTSMTDHREDRDKLINPSDVASFIYNICCQDFKSFKIPELDIWRK